jgi:hypothetical protein
MEKHATKELDILDLLVKIVKFQRTCTRIQGLKIEREATFDMLVVWYFLKPLAGSIVCRTMTFGSDMFLPNNI